MAVRGRTTDPETKYRIAKLYIESQADVEQGEFCHSHGITRRTLKKWMEQYETGLS